MQALKALSVVIWLYGWVQGAIWIFRGRADDAIIIMLLTPLLFFVYLLIRYIQKKKDERIDRELEYSNEEHPKSTLFKDE